MQNYLLTISLRATSESPNDLLRYVLPSLLRKKKSLHYGPLNVTAVEEPKSEGGVSIAAEFTGFYQDGTPRLKGKTFVNSPLNNRTDPVDHIYLILSLVKLYQLSKELDNKVKPWAGVEEGELETLGEIYTLAERATHAIVQEFDFSQGFPGVFAYEVLDDISSSGLPYAIWNNCAVEGSDLNQVIRRWITSKGLLSLKDRFVRYTVVECFERGESCYRCYESPENLPPEEDIFLTVYGHREDGRQMALEDFNAVTGLNDDGDLTFSQWIARIETSTDAPVQRVDRDGNIRQTGRPARPAPPPAPPTLAAAPTPAPAPAPAPESQLAKIERVLKACGLTMSEWSHSRAFSTIYGEAPVGCLIPEQQRRVLEAVEKLKAEGITNATATRFSNPPYRNQSTGKMEVGHPRHGHPLLEIGSVYRG